MREVYLAYSTDGLSIGFAVFAAKPVIYLSQSRSMQFSEINAVCYLRFFRYRLVAILHEQNLINILSLHRDIYNFPFISAIVREREREREFECNKIIR